MRSLLDELKTAREEMEALEEKFEVDCENIELESRCDKAYERYYGIAQEVARKIVVFTSGKITFQTARQIVYQKPDELQRILN